MTRGENLTPGPAPHPSHHPDRLAQSLLSTRHVIDPWKGLSFSPADRGGFLLEDRNGSILQVMSPSCSEFRCAQSGTSPSPHASRSRAALWMHVIAWDPDLELPRRSTAVSATVRPPCLVGIGASPPDSAALSQTQDTRLWSLKSDARRL
jgi:hypothetical protein